MNVRSFSPEPAAARFSPGRRVLLLGGLGAMLPAVGTAQANEAETARSGLRPMGQTRLRVWGFEVYDASLHVGPGFDGERYEEHRFTLELRYLRRLRGRDIAQRSIDEMRPIAQAQGLPWDDGLAQRWLQTMQSLFPDVDRDDRILGEHRPGERAVFYVNGARRGDVADARFARLFFGIWLAPQTSQPAMRQALLTSPAR